MTEGSTTEPPPPRPQPWAHYQPHPHAFDEWFASNLLLRPHCAPLARALEQLGAEEFLARRDNAQRILRDHGVNFDAFGDRQNLERPWELDLLPFLLPVTEWNALANGIAQRTRLLNAFLADAYGPRSLLSSGLLPPPLLYANPDFLRPCVNSVHDPRSMLVLHAVDLGRAPSGQWFALSDSTQAPYGTGYTLENRIVLSRVLPDEFQDSHVLRLAPFFQFEQNTLQALARSGGDRPAVVLLTPGAASPGYFEHAYLARYLGLPLVEGGDLTVRHNHVFLKTLEGLMPVDVILRRTADAFCDPLELRSDSLLGVPGLLQAVRHNHVVVANAIGSGLAESPALLPFLPALCRHLLQEDLLLPSIPTWWCGQTDSLQHTLDNFDQLVIRRAFPSLPVESIRPGLLSQTERSACIDRIRQNPHAYVAQAPLVLSRSPALHQGNLEPRALTLRAFACHSATETRVLPGGLPRLAPSREIDLVPTLSGGISKDAWILNPNPVQPVSLLPPPGAVLRLERAAAEVPSRVADNLFWLGRYAERLEDTVRVLRAVLSRLVGEARYEHTPELESLVRLLIALDLFPDPGPDRLPLRRLEREVLALVYQAHRLGTVREILDRIRRIIWIVRDRFSADTWRILNKLQADARPRPGRLPLAEAHSLLNALVVDLAAFSGLELENMTRGHAWHFLDLGRRLERAANMTALARASVQVLRTTGLAPFEPMLEIADSTMTYRRRYFAHPQPLPVLSLLLADLSNPRSLAFQLHAMADHASRLPGDHTAPAPSPEQSCVQQAQEQLQSLNLHAPHAVFDEAFQLSLLDTLSTLAANLQSFSSALTRRYFSHAETHVA